MRERMNYPDSLHGMPASDRYYSETLAEHARKELRAFVVLSGGQLEAAKSLGVNQSTLSRSLKGQPSLRVLIALADKRGCTVDELLGRSAASEQESRIAAEVVRQLKKQSSSPPSHVRRSNPPPAKT